MSARIAIAVLAAGLLPVAAAGDHWPAWRGPHGNGHTSESVVPWEWSAESAHWKTPIPGVGHSSPVVFDDQVFLTSSGVRQPDDRCLICVDAVTGDVLWIREIYRSPVEPMHRLNSPASSTPAVDESRVYVTFAENGYVGVAAVSRSGEIEWTTRPGSFESRHGFHSCPVLWNDFVLVNGEQDGSDAFVAALDRATGDIVWKTARSQTIRSFVAPLVLPVGGTTQVVLSGSGETVAWDAMSGREIWKVTGPAEKTVSSMLTDGHTVFVPGGRDNLLLAIDPTGVGDVTDTHIRWSATKGIPYVPSPLLSDGRLHIVSDEGIYCCYDAESGELQKQVRLASRTSSSLLGVAGTVWVTDDSGTTYIVSGDGSGHVLQKNELGEPVYASLAIAGGRLFIRSEEHLFCFHAAPEGD